MRGSSRGGWLLEGRQGRVVGEEKHHDCEWWIMGRETVRGGVRGEVVGKWCSQQ